MILGIRGQNSIRLSREFFTLVHFYLYLSGYLYNILTKVLCLQDLEYCLLDPHFIFWSGPSQGPRICYGRCVSVKVECGLGLNLDWTSDSEFYFRHRLLDTIRKE